MYVYIFTKPNPINFIFRCLKAMWVLHYTWWAVEMSFLAVVNSWMVCQYCLICSLIYVTDAKPSSNFYHKVCHKIRVLIPSSKIGCQENAFGEPLATSDSPYPLSRWREGHAINTYLATRSGPFLISLRDWLCLITRPLKFASFAAIF